MREQQLPSCPKNLQRYSRDLLSQLLQEASHFKGCWRNLHGLEFPSDRRYSVPHAKPYDFTDSGTHEAICNPTCFTSVCQRTSQYPLKDNTFLFAFIPHLAKGEFSLVNVKTLINSRPVHSSSNCISLLPEIFWEKCIIWHINAKGMH